MNNNRAPQPGHFSRPPRRITVAATQFSCGWDRAANIDRAETLVRRAARDGAQMVLLQELFETPYFCIEQDTRHMRLATALADNPAVKRMVQVASELNVVVPVSFFEHSGQAYFNTVAVIDAGGEVLGTYRKAHIPNGPGYQEKTYFSPGDTGFRVWDTKFGRIGVGICWDQWFPECARAMALMGAELLFYPTAIGSEPPPAQPVQSRDHWRRTQQGHAAANLVPLIASNRIGTERSLQSPEDLYIRFYGSSFIADAQGALLAEADEESEAVILAQLDLAQTAELRDNWFVFRDRRPELYTALTSLDGQDSTARGRK
jgi:N-carbamoylputrescine amidase